MYACFRPGDIVRAEILSLGDQRSYYLTTAKNELGVVYAKSVAGEGPIRHNSDEGAIDVLQLAV
jgi:exosome complex RNA-binding protein Csl4